MQNSRKTRLFTLIGIFLLLSASTALAEASSSSESSTSGAEDAAFSTCFSKYALCISAPCKKVPGETISLNGKEYPKASCECEMMFGYNIGSTTCEERVDQQRGSNALSTYSVAQTEGKGLLQCEGGEYTDCFNFPCTVDPDHPYRAVCSCPVLTAKKEESIWVTRGGQCRAGACQGLWSAAPKSADLLINQVLWKQLGFTVDPPTGYTKVPPSNSCGITGRGSSH